MVANITELLSSLGQKRSDVYLSITPGIGLEMIQVDLANNQIKNYSVRPISYNESLRELTNLEELKTAVSEMYTELNLSPKCNIILNMPTVLFGSMEINLMLGDDAILGAATSEVEQSYVFKRHDPIVKWFDSNLGTNENRKIFYSAVQKLVVENISQALAELGSNLIGVEMSLLSTLRALDITGLAAEEMKSGVTWNILTVNGTGYTIVSMSGKNIVDYYEEPLPVNSYEGDEIYNAISASVQISLMSLPANYLMVISDTNSVSAEILAKNLNVEYTIEYVENNKFKRNAFMAASLDVIPDMAQKASLQAIGCAISRGSDYPLRCDFLQSEDAVVAQADELVTLPIGEEGYQVSATTAQIVAFVAMLIMLGIAGLGMAIFPKQRDELQGQLDSLNAEISKLDKEIKDMEKESQTANKFSIKDEINAVLKDNRAKLIAYSAIGEAVPNNLWLESFVTANKGEITVLGGAGSVEDVYTFYRNLKESTNASGLQLKKLEMQSDNVDEFVSNMPVVYAFEISNYTPPKKAEPEDDGKGGKGPKGPKGAKGKPTGKAANIEKSKLLSDVPIN